jgi:4-aminobutyrate aminotransferase
VDGNVFLDCTAGIAVTTPPAIRIPMWCRASPNRRALPPHVGHRLLLRAAGALGEALSAIAPMPGPHRTFFGNSGTEAVEAALKLAKFYTKRPNVIAFLGAFHGRSMGSLSLTASRITQRRGFGPFVPGVYHAPYAELLQVPGGVAPSESCAAECLRYLEDQILVHLVSPDEVAAVMVEPIQGEGGYVVPPDVFLQRLRELTRQHGILLVVDEVQSGMGRTGKMFAIEHTGVEPDVVTMAKGIASGLPLGVATARATMCRGRRAPREHVRRQPRVVRRGARHDPAAARRAREERREVSART